MKNQQQGNDGNAFRFYPGYFSMDYSHSEESIFSEERTVLLHMHRGKNHSAW